MQQAEPVWPGGARCAVMLTFDFDAEAGWLSRGASVKTLKIRSRKAPLLTSRCLPPGATKTVACSAG